MRVKNIDSDYKYFTEPNIAPIKLSDEFIKSAIETSNELAEQKHERYMKLGLSKYDADLLTNNKDMCSYFDEMVDNGANPKQSANWIITRVQEVLNKREIEIKDFPISASDLADLIKFIQKGAISNKQARDIFGKMLTEGKKPSEYISESDTQIINDSDAIRNEIIKVIDSQPSIIIDYKNGKEKVAGFIVGQVMKSTQGKANPSLTSKLVIEVLKEK